MSDELNDLKLALQTTTPAPEATRKAAHLTLVEKNLTRSKKPRLRSVKPLGSPKMDVLKE